MTDRISGASGAAAVAKATKPRRRRGTRGVLWAIALMFALSGLMRLGGEPGFAIASGLVSLRAPGLDSDETGCAPPPDIAEVLALLDMRSSALTERESALADRVQALVVVEAQIASNMAALTEAEASLEATIALASTAAEDDLARLTTVYENMKAKEAAPLFAAMSPDFAAGFLGRMRPDAAAAIMARLEPSAAYSISVLLAGRNAAVPTE
jgi:flagellar motility protein MotE (MotC chaperone)